MNGTIKVALTIAGSDCSGGAGIQADLKTFQALGVFGMSAITAVTVQNTQKVYAIQEIEPQMVYDQIACLFDDIAIDAVKIGMVASVPSIEAIARALTRAAAPPVVLDPVMAATCGHVLMDDDARRVLIDRLFPLAEVVTPNIDEAEALTGMTIATESHMRDCARRLVELGAAKVVVKGGHMQGESATDILYDGRRFESVQAPRIDTRNTHGTGCTFASAIAAHLALGHSFFDAVTRAKTYISGAIAHCLDIGKGHGPTHHFFDLYARAGILPRR